MRIIRLSWFSFCGELHWLYSYPFFFVVAVACSREILSTIWSNRRVVRTLCKWKKARIIPDNSLTSTLVVYNRKYVVDTLVKRHMFRLSNIFDPAILRQCEDISVSRNSRYFIYNTIKPLVLCHGSKTDWDIWLKSICGFFNSNRSIKKNYIGLLLLYKICQKRSSFQRYRFHWMNKKPVILTDDYLHLNL